MSFNVEEFVNSPSWELFELAKKTDLISLVKHYSIHGFRSGMRKDDIKFIVKNFLMKENVLSDETGIAPESFLCRNSDSDNIYPEHIADQGNLVNNFDHSPPSEVNNLLRNSLDDREFELKRLELIMKTEELKLKQLERSSEINPVYRSQASSNFDCLRHIKLVPKFRESEVDKYFLQFERVAQNFGWPRDVWTVLLQSVLTAYECVPEKYRQLFRKRKKNSNESYPQFVAEKRQIFRRWYQSSKVNSFEKLEDLILLEDFYDGLLTEVRLYLSQRGEIGNIEQAARLVEDYYLLRNGVKNYKNPTSYFNSQNSNNITCSPSKIKNKNDIVPNNNNNFDNNSNIKGTNSNYNKKFSLKVTCSYCKRVGHKIADCYLLQRKNKNKTTSKPSGVISKLNQVSSENKIEKENVASHEMTCYNSFRLSKKSTLDKFEPFLSIGSVSLNYNINPVSIKILRDTGASQSLILDTVLPFTDNSFTGKHVTIQGVGSQLISLPIHNIYLNSKCAQGNFEIGVIHSLPFEDVTLILGNDIAGGVVNASSILNSKLNNDSENPCNNSELYPACVVTPSINQEENKIPNNNEDIELSSTFIADIFNDINSLYKLFIFLPILNNSLCTRFLGLYTINKNSNELNYVIKTSDYRKLTQLCYINMLKKHLETNKVDCFINNVTLLPQNNVSVVSESVFRECETKLSGEIKDALSMELDNSFTLQSKFEHLTSAQTQDFINLLEKFKSLFSDVPGRTHLLYLMFELKNDIFIKQHLCLLNTMKLKFLDEEFELTNDFIEFSFNDWTSSHILVPKPDSTYRSVIPTGKFV
ncbi:hypothetical protein O3M35_007837 [Rhynocoris fuscipes]|uniref:Peptidase A2 domain-containing protein n=1 Tax=Rhynocoris fuscipes TaxID=488301 RepID=A0AAW1DDB0_9HEMI